MNRGLVDKKRKVGQRECPPFAEIINNFIDAGNGKMSEAADVVAFVVINRFVVVLGNGHP